MASFSTYADLQTTILAWMARPGDTQVQPADLIALFEEEARDRLRTRLGETSTTLTTTADLATIALPALYEGHREMVLQTSPTVFIKYITPEVMDGTWVDGATGAPEFFTVKGTSFTFAPTPDAVYSIALDYNAGISSLSNANPTNWLLLNYPSLYLAGSMLWGEAFIGNDERVPGWVQLRESIFNRIMMADLKQRWTGGTLTVRTDTGNP